MMNAVLGAIGDFLPPVGPLERWMRFREAPTFAGRSLHRRLKKEGGADE
jgi:hypothetical protein